MSQQRLTAGSDLFAPGTGDPAEWLAATDEWRKAAKRLRVRVVVTAGYWGQLQACGSEPSYERIKQALDRAGMGSLVETAMTIVAALQSATETVHWVGVLTEWSASGCLGSKVHPGIAEEVVVAASRLLPPGARCVAGATTRDEEDIRMQGIDVDGLSDVSETLRVSCHPRVETYLETLDPIDFVDEPELAVEISSARLQRTGSGRLSRFQVLPEFGASLARMDASMKRRTFEAMAHLLLPKPQRPPGLEEHAVRTGVGANASSLRSRRGVFLRVDLSKHGIGWRLHLWRGQDGVTFSHVAPKNAPLAIYE
jgi:hypothetical protein